MIRQEIDIDGAQLFVTKRYDATMDLHHVTVTDGRRAVDIGIDETFDSLSDAERMARYYQPAAKALSEPR